MHYWFSVLVQLTILLFPFSTLANQSINKLRDRDATDFFWCSTDGSGIDLFAFHKDKGISTKFNMFYGSKKQEAAISNNDFIKIKWSSDKNNTSITRTINLNEMTYKIEYKGDWPMLGKRKAQAGTCERKSKQRYLEIISRKKEEMEALCRYNRRDDKWRISSFCKELCDNNIDNPFCKNTR